MPRTEVKAVKLLSITDTPEKVPSYTSSKRYQCQRIAVLEMADGRHLGNPVQDDTRVKLAERIERAQKRCANGITGMSLSDDGCWISNIFGGTWV